MTTEDTAVEANEPEPVGETVVDESADAPVESPMPVDPARSTAEPDVTPSPAATTELVCENGHTNNWLETFINGLEETFHCRCGAAPVTVTYPATTTTAAA